MAEITRWQACLPRQFHVRISHNVARAQQNVTIAAESRRPPATGDQADDATEIHPSQVL